MSVNKDKKLKAMLNKSKEVNDEIKTRLREQGQLFNTEDRGYLEVDHERERTVKVTQSQLKDLLPT